MRLIAKAAVTLKTIKVMLKDELHQTSGVIAAQIEEKVTKSITEKTKLWSSLLKAKTTATVDDDMLNHIVNKTADHQVEVTEIKNCDTDLQRKRRVRNVVIKKVTECSAKDARKRMEYDMKILTDVIYSISFIFIYIIFYTFYPLMSCHSHYFIFLSHPHNII